MDDSSRYVREKWPCQNKEGEPWDGKNQTFVFQVSCKRVQKGYPGFA